MTFQTQIIAALVAFIAAVGAALAWGEHRYDQGEEANKKIYQAALDRQKIRAAATLASETSKVADREAELQEIKNQQDQKDATHKTAIADLSDRLRRAAGPTGRLRDPHATPGCGGGSSGPAGEAATATAGGSADPAETGGLLSVPLTDLLAEVLRESDDINAAYASCRADAYTLRADPVN